MPNLNAVFDVKNQIEKLTPEQMALLNKKAEEKNLKTNKSTWWSKRTKTQKSIIVGGSLLVIGLISYRLYKKFSKN